MPISKFFTTSVVVKRLVFANDSSALTSQTTFNGHIQQVRPELAQEQGFRYGELFYIWCPVDTDVERSDRLEVGSDTYDIQDVEEFSVGNEQHLQLTATLHNIT